MSQEGSFSYIKFCFVNCHGFIHIFVLFLHLVHTASERWVSNAGRTQTWKQCFGFTAVVFGWLIFFFQTKAI